MNSATRLALLGAALAPYVAVVSVDAWMHERARRVPRLEQVFHAAAAVLFLGFVIAVFRGATTLAMTLFALFAICTACDELGFHGQLAARERWVHFAAYAALAVFLGVWRWTEVAA
jgi:hypothetical protein